MNGQRHFYMEVQNAVATPTEDSRLLVVAGTQSQDTLQAAIGSVVSLPLNCITIKSARTGGAFGAARTACCAAVAGLTVCCACV